MARLFIVAVLCLVGIVPGCRRPHPDADRAGASLRTDAAEYVVEYTGTLYRAAIGYTYVNRTRTAVSAHQCQTPSPPALEKAVNGHWVPAYAPEVFLCESIPPFRVPAGGTYRGTLALRVAHRDRHTSPELLVDSIPGTYRLRWVLRAGSDPADTTAAWIEVVSNSFRLVER